MKIVWAETALADREAIYDYIEADNPRAAAELDRLFDLAARRLVDHPELGRPGRIAGTRELVAHPRYLLLYEIDADRLTILAVVHTSRKWPPAALLPGSGD